MFKGSTTDNILYIKTNNYSTVFITLFKIHPTD